MGYIKEPKGIDFIVGPTTLTEEDANLIKEAIVAYKRRRKVPSVKDTKNNKLVIARKNNH